MESFRQDTGFPCPSQVARSKARTVALRRDDGRMEWTSQANQPGAYFFGFSYCRAGDGSKILLAAWYSTRRTGPSRPEGTISLSKGRYLLI